MATVETPLFVPGRDVSDESAERTRRAEACVRDAAEQYLAPALGDCWALAAVGGFGRGDLFPFSDIDLLILVSRPEDAQNAKDAIGYFLRTIWDAKLAPSHSVHTVEECCRLDTTNIELTISLLTERYLCGSEALYGRLRAQLPAFIRSQRRTVSDHLLRLTSERHQKYQSTIYHMEPDVKETPGGFRDLHLIEWLGTLRGTPNRDALAALAGARSFLANVRTCLHERAGRDDNRLTFAAQDDLFAHPADAMREYYRHTRAISREAQHAIAGAQEPGSGMIRSFLDWRSRLSTSEFTVSRDQVLLRTPQALASDSKLVLRLMQFIARHNFMLAPDTERRVAEAIRTHGFALPAVNLWREWKDLLSLPHTARAVRAMQETGLLKLLIPEWSRIECLVTRDFYHRYTVDEHTLVTLENVELLANSRDDSRRQFAELLSETPDLYLLRTALLLHDIGKGGGSGEHAEKSAEIGADVLARMGAPEEDREMILYLVRHHLDLSSLMMTRDLHDPDVVRTAAQGIGTLERLHLLTLLTFADISAVNPGALTPWRASQLWSAYRSLNHELTRELDTDRIEPAAGIPSERDTFLRGFPTRYLLVQSRADVDRHFLMTQEAADAGASVDLKHGEESWIATVVTKDRPCLLADLAGTLSAFGMNILHAEAFGNQQDLVLDVFRFADTARRLELNPDEVQDLRKLLMRVALGQANVKQMLAARPKPIALSRRGRIAPHAFFDIDASLKATLLEVVAEDRPGLLYDIANVISEEACNIEVLLVNTEAHKAVDVFYVTHNGNKLGSVKREALQEKLLKALQ